MIQYCRYCAYMICGDANWCGIKKRTFSDASIKSTNGCKDFKLNPIDASGENPNEYKPRISTIYRKGEFSDEDIKELEGQCEMLLEYTERGESNG